MADLRKPLIPALGKHLNMVGQRESRRHYAIIVNGTNYRPEKARRSYPTISSVRNLSRAQRPCNAARPASAKRCNKPLSANKRNLMLKRHAHPF